MINNWVLENIFVYFNLVHRMLDQFSFKSTKFQFPRNITKCRQLVRRIANSRKLNSWEWEEALSKRQLDYVCETRTISELPFLSQHVCEATFIKKHFAWIKEVARSHEWFISGCRKPFSSVLFWYCAQSLIQRNRERNEWLKTKHFYEHLTIQNIGSKKILGLGSCKSACTFEINERWSSGNELRKKR